MSEPDPALFYTGLVAALYAPLRGSAPDADAYARFIAASGQPALELGCGDGDPLLDLRARGLDVDGIDSSPDMIERLQARAAAFGVSVNAYVQRIESLELSRTYASIFLAVPRSTCCPTPTPDNAFSRFREHVDEDGAVLRFAAIDEERDETRRLQTTTLRYERVVDGQTEALERPWVLHWYPRDVWDSLVAAAGLVVTTVVDANGGLAAAGADTGGFWLNAR